MKIHRFQQQLTSALNHPSGLLITLRHGKILINSLLGWCSAGLISSYMLTVAIGIHFYNQLLSLSAWMSNLILVLFILLFTLLLFIQYRYSEKRTGNLPLKNNDIQLNLSGCYKTNQKLIIVYLIATLGVWLSITFIPASDKYITTGSLMIFALALYFFGLFLIRNLLKTKCAIRQLINKIGSL
jgi:preprotein translocase subunit YajC